MRSRVIQHLFNSRSLASRADGFAFSLKNRIGDFEIERLLWLRVNGRMYAPDQIRLAGEVADYWSPECKLPVVLGGNVEIEVISEPLAEGKHRIELAILLNPYGKIKLSARATLHDTGPGHESLVPRGRGQEDYQPEIIAARQEFLRRQTGAQFPHIGGYSFEPERAGGNVEQFIGAAQVPMGLCGPILIHGEHAQGEFYVPLATSEGTLVASYNRGAKVLNLAGGVTCTVVQDCMQRAPVFTFGNAREARDFAAWVEQRRPEITAVAEATSSVAKLLEIQVFQAIRFTYLRFSFSTGDAAGQNMVGRATFAACNWILEHYQEHLIVDFFLESNMATDKKSSAINVLHTRGKRVTAECLIPNRLLQEHLRCDSATLFHHSQVAGVGGFLSRVNNTGCHSANALAALFIATGQDVANLAESSAGLTYCEVNESGDLYLAVTLPSLIVATHGGGTGLPTQRESLEILGCFGRGGARKFAEIVAGVVLAGELSLAAAISSYDWVASHERLGRHRT